VLDLNLPGFNTVICNARTKFNLCAANVINRVIQAFIVLISVSLFSLFLSVSLSLS